MARNRPTKEFAVVGLGRFGSSVALTLVDRGFPVLGLDIDRAVVQRYADELTHTVALDATDEEALSAIDIGSIDTVIVSMAQHFESSILATVAMKNLGVRCVICKALSERQAEILSRVGADQIVLPEKEAGQRLALELAMPELVDSMVLGPGHSVAEVHLPAWLEGRSLAETRLRDRFGVTVLVVKSGETLLVSPPSTYLFRKGDVLVVIGTEAAVNRLTRTR